MNIKCYLINLDKASERLEYVMRSFGEISFTIERVSGVLGTGLELPIAEYSKLGYAAAHGKRTNTSEIGCYLSHIKALKQFMGTDNDYAIILEDDVELRGDLELIIKQLTGCSLDWDIVRLAGRRKTQSLPVRQLFLDTQLHVDFSRQTGAGAYLVNRKAARRMINQMLPMYLPYDHAFDREWLMGLRNFSVQPFPINQQEHEFESQIVISKKDKYPKLLRIWTVLPYRFFTELSRVIYRTCIYMIAKYKFRSAR